MRVVLDTNVLISATFWAGSSDLIMQKIENQEIDLILSESILEEFSKVLNYQEIKDKIKNKNLEMRRTFEKVTSLSILNNPLIKLDTIKEDQSDNIILECALEGKADYIISQDLHLLKIKEFEGIKILTPSQFLEILNKKRG